MSKDAPGPSPELSNTDTADVRRQGAPRLTGTARALALEVAAEVRAEWSYTTDILARAFRTHRQLPSVQRRLCAETVYGLIRWDRRLDAILDEVETKLRRRDRMNAIARDESKLLVYEARAAHAAGHSDLEEAVRADLRRRLAAEPPWESVVGDDAGLGKRTGIEREAVRLSYPTWLFERFVLDLGLETALQVGAAMNQRAPMTVNLNGVRGSREELAARLREEGVATHPTPLSASGLVFDTRVNAFGLPAFQDGWFEVMDEGSQLVAEAVAPPPQGHVVDACAGAGGKTLALASLLRGQGRLLAMDTSGKKLEELRRRSRRAGLSNVVARPIEGTTLPAEARPGAWSRVLVDAPCSGLGTLRRNPEARWRATPATVDRFPALQVGLMVTYAPLVEVGGRLIYATCTVLRQENEEVVARFLEERPEFVPVPLKEIVGRERAERMGDGMTLRLYPHRHDTDGFYAAVLRRVR